MPKCTCSMARMIRVGEWLIIRNVLTAYKVGGRMSMPWQCSVYVHITRVYIILQIIFICTTTCQHFIIDITNYDFKYISEHYIPSFIFIIVVYRFFKL